MRQTRPLFYWLLAALSVSACTQKKNDHELRVLTYSSMASAQGLGPHISELFTQMCQKALRQENCALRLSPEAGDSSLLNRFKQKKYDAVLGLSSIEKDQAQKLFPEAHFVLFARSPHAFVADTEKFPKKNWPTSWKEVPKKLRGQLAYADPRLSSAGLGLLEAVFRFNLLPLEFLKQGEAKLFPSWSQSYEAFTSGKASVVWSYASSEAYHRCEEKTNRFVAIPLKEGYPQAEEWLAIHKEDSSALTRLLSEVLLAKTIQEKVALENWMLPVSNISLPECFEASKNISITTAPSKNINTQEWLDRWSL